MFGLSSRVRVLLLIGVPVVVLLAAVVALNQLGGSRSDPSQEQTGGSLVWGVSEEPDTLDPQKMWVVSASLIMQYVSDPLIARNPEGEYVPGLAKSWEQSEDGLTWTFELKEGVKFHDGTPLDAAAVKASFERVLDPKTKAGAAASMLSEVESVSTPAKHTLEIRLKRPYPALLDNLSFPQTAPVNVEAAKRMGNEFGRKPIMTGPWKVASWESGERVVLERNPDYEWGPSYAHQGPPYIQRLEFRIMPDTATRISAFQANEIQIVNEVPPINVQQLKEAGKYKLYSSLRQGLDTPLVFNVEKAPFDDPLVRKALNYAINKEPIAEIAWRGQGQPACGPLWPSVEGYWPGICEYAPGYDPERARQLLAEAGWEPGPDGILTKDGEPFEFTAEVFPDDIARQSTELVQEQLKDIGVKMEIQTLEVATLVTRANTGEGQAYFLGYFASNPDILYTVFHSSQMEGGLNWSRYSDPRLDAMLENARTEPDDEVRMRIYRDIQKYIVDKSLLVPLLVTEVYVVIQPHLKGAEIGKNGTLFLSDARIEE